MDALQSAHQLLSTDPAGALEEFRRLADAGSRMSLMYIGNIFEDGLGVKIDLAEAEKFYRRAVECAAPNSRFSLAAVLWKQGDYDKAQKYLSVGVQNNHARSMYWLARLYLRNKASPAQVFAGVDLLKRAAALGHVRSEKDLGKLLLTGRFGIVNIFRGLKMIFMHGLHAGQLAAKNPSDEMLADLNIKFK